MAAAGDAAACEQLSGLVSAAQTDLGAKPSGLYLGIQLEFVAPVCGSLKVVGVLSEWIQDATQVSFRVTQCAETKSAKPLAPPFSIRESQSESIFPTLWVCRFWPMFSQGLKRSAFYFQILWACEVYPFCSGWPSLGWFTTTYKQPV